MRRWVCCERRATTDLAVFASRQIKKFAQKTMKTSDVRIDVKLNKAVWSKGIRNVRISLSVRVRCRRR